MRAMAFNMLSLLFTLCRVFSLSSICIVHLEDGRSLCCEKVIHSGLAKINFIKSLNGDLIKFIVLVNLLKL